MQACNQFLSISNSIRQKLGSRLSCEPLDYGPDTFSSEVQELLEQTRGFAKSLDEKIPELNRSFGEALADSLNQIVDDAERCGEKVDFDDYFSLAFGGFISPGRCGEDYGFSESLELMGSLFQLMDHLICFMHDQNPHLKRIYLGKDEEEIMASLEAVDSIYQLTLEMATKILNSTHKVTKEALIKGIELTESFYRPHDLMECLNVRALSK